MKACKDCRYHRWTFPSLFDSGLSRCTNPSFMKKNPITGEDMPAFASLARQFNFLCGEQAIKFESKRQA